MTERSRVGHGQVAPVESLGSELADARLPAYRELFGQLEGEDLGRLGEAVAAEAARIGMGFNSSDGDSVFRVDPIPRLITRAEWDELRTGLAQRWRALNAFIADAYGDREIVAAGRMPEHVIESADHFEPLLAGVEIGERPACVVGFDLVRGADGELRVLEDNLRTPSGITYALGARRALDAALATAAVPSRLDATAAIGMLRSAIEGARRREGASVLLTEGETAGAYFEHRELAEALDLPLVRPGDLRLDGDRLVASVEGRRVDVAVAYRRTDEDRLRDPQGRPTWLERLLLPAVSAGTLAIVNQIGTGVADDKLTHAYVDAMVEFYLGEDPILRSVRTYDLSGEETREEMLGRIDEIVLKPRSGLGGKGVFIGAAASPQGRAEAAAAVRANPREFVAQETVELSTHPTVVDGGLEPRHIDLRVYAVDGQVAPVALTRFAPGAGDLVVNSSGGGGGKDTWILS